MKIAKAFAVVDAVVSVHRYHSLPQGVVVADIAELFRTTPFNKSKIAKIVLSIKDAS
jgi:hypothetical protein